MNNEPDFFIRVNDSLIISDNLIISNGVKTIKLNSLEKLPELFRLGWIVKVVPLIGGSNTKNSPSTKGIEIFFIDELEIKDAQTR